MAQRIYWIDYRTSEGFDRNCHIQAQTPQQALHQFNMEYGMSEITDFIDTTDSKNWKNVFGEIFEPEED